MRAFKLVGAMVLVVAFSAIGVSTASAVELVLWRFLPGAKGTQFIGKSAKALFQVKGGLSFTSPESTATGEITEGEGSLGLALVSLVKTTSGGLPINSLGDASGVILVHVELHNCILEDSSLGVLLAFLPLHLEVPSTKLLMAMTGSLVGKISSGKSKTFTLAVEQKEGKQAVEKCKGDPADTLLTSIDSGAATQTGQEIKSGSLTFTTIEQETMTS